MVYAGQDRIDMLAAFLGFACYCPQPLRSLSRPQITQVPSDFTVPLVEAFTHIATVAASP